VRECKNCGYLLAAGWTECKRCGAPASAPAPTVAAPPPVAAQWGGPTVNASTPTPTLTPPADSGFDPRYAAPARIGYPGSVSPMPASGWVAPPPSVKPVKTKGRGLFRFVAFAAAGIAAVVGFNAVQTWRTAPPAEVKSYLHGDGVTYSPRGLGFSVRLPEQPQETTQTETVSGASVTIHMATIEKSNWEVALGVVELPIVVPEADADAVLRGSIAGVTTVPGMAGTIEEQTSTTFQGHHAVDATLKADDGHPVEIKTVAVGSRLYILAAHSVRATSDLIDEMADSFTLESAA
jgi:hypothetical protein